MGRRSLIRSCGSGCVTEINLLAPFVRQSVGILAGKIYKGTKI